MLLINPIQLHNHRNTFYGNHAELLLLIGIVNHPAHKTLPIIQTFVDFTIFTIPTADSPTIASLELLYLLNSVLKSNLCNKMVIEALYPIKKIRSVFLYS